MPAGALQTCSITPVSLHAPRNIQHGLSGACNIATSHATRNIACNIATSHATRNIACIITCNIGCNIGCNIACNIACNITCNITYTKHNDNAVRARSA